MFGRGAPPSSGSRRARRRRAGGMQVAGVRRRRSVSESAASHTQSAPGGRRRLPGARAGERRRDRVDAAAAGRAPCSAEVVAGRASRRSRRRSDLFADHVAVGLAEELLDAGRAPVADQGDAARAAGTRSRPDTRVGDAGERAVRSHGSMPCRTQSEERLRRRADAARDGAVRRIAVVVDVLAVDLRADGRRERQRREGQEESRKCHLRTTHRNLLG